MADSKIVGNSGDGIGVSPGCVAHISDSEVSGNGIGALAMGGGLVANEGATISNNAGRVIEAPSTSTHRLTDSYVETNGSDGILPGDLNFQGD